MAKLAFLLLSVIALQITLAGPINSQQRQLQQLSDQILEISSNAADLIENQRIGNIQEKRYLSLQANEYINSIENVIYNLQRPIQNIESWQNLLQLQQILRRLSEIVYSIRAAINGEASQLRLQLSLNIQNVRIEAQRLIEIAQQLLNESRIEQNILNREIRLALNSILRANLGLQIQARLQLKSRDEIRAQIQSLAPALSSVLDNINDQDEIAVQNLANRAWELSRISGRIVNRLQSGLRIIDDEAARNVLREVLARLSEIRIALYQASIISDVSKVQELRIQLKLHLSVGLGQIEKLLQLIQSDNQDNQQIQILNNILQISIIDAISSAENLRIQIRIAGGQIN